MSEPLRIEHLEALWDQCQNAVRQPKYEIVSPQEYKWRSTRPRSTHYDYLRMLATRRLSDHLKKRGLGPLERKRALTRLRRHLDEKA